MLINLLTVEMKGRGGNLKDFHPLKRTFLNTHFGFHKHVFVIRKTKQNAGYWHENGKQIKRKDLV